MLREKLQISRERAEFFYSIFILLVVPLLIAVNTLLLINNVRKDYDTVLRRKADAINSSIVEAASDRLSEPTGLQNTLLGISHRQDEIQRISVLISTPIPTQYKILATTEESASGKVVSSVQYGAAATTSRSVATLITNSDGRYWRLVTPLLDDKGGALALIESDISLKSTDQLINKTLLTSFGVMALTMIVVILLLLNHFKFIQYALLFRKLKEVDQLKNDFLSVASHELRAPMTVIKGSVENMIDGLSGSIDDQAKAGLQQISEETDRLGGLVGDLLNVSRIEQGRVTYDLQPIDVRDIIDQLVKTFGPKASAKGLSVSYERPETAAVASLDKGRMIEIMTNLLDNAIKYSRTGTITVRHKDDHDRLRISIKDTGIGMGAEARDRLFTRFYRVQNDKTHDIPGTGLGLWIVKQYVEHMAGSIEVDSIEDVGTEFTVGFPRLK